jgi:hypothetical protein
MKRTKPPQLTGLQKVQQLLIRIRNAQQRGDFLTAKKADKQLHKLQRHLIKKSKR